jgi:hypothetical protein
MEVGCLDPGRLVFVDEMDTHTSLAPLYVYAPIGERAFFEIPRNRGKNTPLLASLRSGGMGPSMAVEGATTACVFEAYVEHLRDCLSSTLAIWACNTAQRLGLLQRPLRLFAGCCGRVTRKKSP